MALTVKDRVKESSTTTGTADFTLGGAAAGFQTFAVIGNSNTTYYAAVDQATGDWEVGVGTYSSTGPTLTRDTVLESSNSGSKVSFAAGSKEVFCTYPAERSVYLDAAGSAVSVLDIGTLGASTANITTANITAGTVTTTPTSGNDLVNKTYVDTLAASGIHFHQPVRVESPINLNATYNNGTSGVGATLTNAGTQVALVIDGITVAVNDRVLVYEQTNETQNGIYVVTSVGSGSTNWVLTRASDADTYVINNADGLSEGSSVFVQQGTTGAGETYTCNTSGVITFGTTNITFAQISSAQIYSAGTGLTLSGTQFSITNTGTAGTYGAAATVPVITTNAQGQVTSVTPTAIAITSAAVSGLAASATTDTTNAANITSGTLPSARLNGSYTGITGVGTLAAGTWNGSVIAAAYGGTGQSSYTVGDLLYASGSTSLAKLADVATGNALISGGVGTAPAWGKIGLTTHVSGTLAVGNGGTGATTLTGYVYGNGTGAFTASTSIPNAATTATSANTASAIVARDGSGNFSAGTITASLNGNASTATTAANVNNGTLTMNVSGTGLSGSQTFTANQSSAATFTVTSNATNANTASTIVARDASGNFSAGTITAALSGNATTATTATNATNVTLTASATASAFKVPFANTTVSTTGNYGLLQDSAAEFTYNPSTNTLTVGTVSGALSGNATTATTLQTARTINGVSFNGSADITVTANTTNTLTPGTYLTGSAFNGSAATTWAVDATPSNSASKIVVRDSSGNFSASTITAALNGNATTATTATNATNVGVTTSFASAAFKVPFTNTTASTTGNYNLLQDSEATFTYNPSSNTLTVGTVSAALTGNATTATTLATGRTINGVSFNGSANITVPVYTSQASDNVAYQIPFVSSVIANNQNLYTDSATNLTYNPSTNTLTTTTFAGALSGNATTATTATNATNVAVTTSATASAFKVPFANTTASTTGNYGLLQDSTATFTYNPSTNTLDVGAVSASNGIMVNSATISASYSIPSGSNAMSAGPVTVASGVTVTVPSGSVWTVI